MINFKTYRFRLLFWFLMFIVMGTLIMVFTSFYVTRKQNIEDFAQSVTYSYNLLLKDFKLTSDFFFQETHNPEFYESAGKSNYSTMHDRISDQLIINLSSLQKMKAYSYFDIREDLEEIQSRQKTYSYQFYIIVETLLERGFQDHGIYGRINTYANQLLKIEDYKKSQFYQVRYYEHLYNERLDNQFAEEFNKEAKLFIASIKNNPTISTSKKDSILFVFDKYTESFNDLIEADRILGLSIGSNGIIQNYELQGKQLEANYIALTEGINIKKAELFSNLKLVFIIFMLVLTIVAVSISLYISKSITKPITKLTDFITKFINSEFTYSEEMHLRKSEDEVGKLANNFNIMRNQIITQINFFKQKVDERTRELNEAYSQLSETNQATERFVPKQFLSFLGYNNIAQVSIGSQVQKEMTVMFADIRNFTSMSEKMSPQETFSFLNEYLKRIGPIVRKNQGFIDKYMGDGIMALYPTADDGLNCAVEMQKKIENFNTIRVRHGYNPISVGMGLHTGSLILGTIGETERMDTTVVSDAVNLASRLEGLSKIYKTNIIISKDLLTNLEKISNYENNFRFLDSVKVKGKDKEVAIYEVLDGLSNEDFDLKMQTRSDFEYAISLYNQRDWQESYQLFTSVLTKNPADKAAQIYIERIEALREGGQKVFDAIEKMRFT